MEIIPTRLPEVKQIVTPAFGDARGCFSETWSRRSFSQAGLNYDFVQDNHSRSSALGTIRGLHFQRWPFAQAKLVRVVRGRILDVAVDLRPASPTFGQSVAVELSAANRRQVLIPVGFAHGFVTLEPETEVLYKVDNPYSSAHDGGVVWNDPDLAIDWPLPPGGPVLSDKDRGLPRLRDLPGGLWGGAQA
jgi:dTDP-4-dehydrorhamnose 3,5-epimerase